MWKDLVSISPLPCVVDAVLVSVELQLEPGNSQPSEYKTVGV